MKNLSKDKIIYWLPRIISFLFVAFISLFALDVFREYQGWAVAVPLLMHLLPTFVLIGVVLVAWKYDLIGATVFIVFAFYYVFVVGLDRHWSWYASISGPAFIVGALFFLSWVQKRKHTIFKGA